MALFIAGLAVGCKQQDKAVAPGAGTEPPVQGQGDSTGMALEGMFRYMADAASFRDCRNGKTYPVSMEGQYIELEHAYLNSGIEPGSEVLIHVQGRLLSRESMEGNTSVIMMIPDTFNSLDPDNSCAPTTHAELTGTYWRLSELGGKAVTAAEGTREAHMVLASGDSGVKGFAGCNSFFGQFETAGDALSFSAMGSTMMACPEGMDIEQDFFTALGATTRYQISGLFLELYADDHLLARLEAVYL
ncbi:META domain-containing protein [Pseudomonadota bacterium]